MVQFGNQERGLGVSDDEVRRRQALRSKRDPGAMEKQWAQDDLVELEVAERMMAPPTIVEPRCHVCSGPFAEYRFYIERQLLKHRSFAAIARSIPPDPKTRKHLDWRSIQGHSEKHMSIDQAAVRAIMEEEADLIQQNYEEGVRGSFTMRGALDVLIRKTYQNALDNVIVVEARDMIQMIKLYNELNANSGSVAMEEAKAVVRIYTEAIKEVLANGDLLTLEQGEAVRNAIVFEVQRLREIEEIGGAMEQALLVEGEIVEATVLDSH